MRAERVFATPLAFPRSFSLSFSRRALECVSERSRPFLEKKWPFSSKTNSVLQKKPVLILFISKFTFIFFSSFLLSKERRDRPSPSRLPPAVPPGPRRGHGRAQARQDLRLVAVAQSTSRDRGKGQGRRRAALGTLSLPRCAEAREDLRELPRELLRGVEHEPVGAVRDELREGGEARCEDGETSSKHIDDLNEFFF